MELPSGTVAVQFYAGRTEAWDTKLARDLEAHETLRKSKRLFFVCAQAPVVERRQIEVRQKKLAQLEVAYGVKVMLLDARVVASTAEDASVLLLLSRFAGIPRAERDARPLPPSVLARLAFTFFHEKSGDFRAEIARSVISAHLLRAPEPVLKETLVDKAIEAAGVVVGAEWSFNRELQAMEVEGEILVDAGRVSASEGLKAFTQTALDLQAGAAARLREACAGALEGRVHDPDRRKGVVDDIFDDLGLLLRESLVDMLPGHSWDATVRRLNAVERRIADHLKPTGGAPQTP